MTFKISDFVVLPSENFEILSEDIKKSSIKYPCCLLIGEQLYKISDNINIMYNFIYKCFL